MSVLINKKEMLNVARQKYRALSIDYDDRADVLYIQISDKKRTLDNRINGDYIRSYNNGELVGITILDAVENYRLGFKF